MRVLLISANGDGATQWDGSAGDALEVFTERSVAAAARRLAALPIDAIVLDAALAREDARSIERLRQSKGAVPLLLIVDETSDAVADLVDRVDAVDCVIPSDAPPQLQARFIRLEAERAHLARELEQRTRELSDRAQESDTRFRNVIERNADAIMVVGGDGVVRFANSVAARLFETARNELIGSSFGFPMVAGDTTELDLVRNGSTRVVEMRVVESEWQGDPACIASLRDITERKRLEENARRLIREQTARIAAETAARRFRFLAESSSVLASSLDYAATLTALARLCVQDIADWVVIYGVDDNGAIQRLEVAHRDPSKAAAVRELREAQLPEDHQHPVLQMLRLRKPLLTRAVNEEGLAALAHNARHLELMRELGVASFMLVPLMARDRAVGAIALVSADAALRYDEEDLALAEDLALRAALAVDNARLYWGAREANQTKTDFLAVISHDLRTPLTSIIGYADLMIMGLPEPLSESNLQRVERMRTAGGQLLYLLDQLLVFARLDAGREEVRLQDTEIRDIVLEVGAVMDPLAAKRGLTLVVDLPEDAFIMQTDPDKLRQVLVNLVANAVKYTDQGEVKLSVRNVPADGIVFQVRDTGMGIAEEHLGRIFDPFWQVDPTLRSGGGGTGLGLSVVRRLVQLMGGEVTVESALGTGSTFTVMLPRRLATGAVPAA